jgi:trigger factor
LELLAKESRFQDISDLLINEEINKMVEELKHGVEEQGGVFDDYLKSLKKTLADVKLDFTPQAITRLKIAIIIKEIAKKEDIKPSEEEVNEEINHVAEHYKENKEASARIHSPTYRDFVENTLRNRKTIEFLRGVMINNA